MKIFYKLELFFIAFSISCFADQITIENQTSDKLFAAPYYVSQIGSKKITRIANPVVLQAQSRLGMERPTFKIGYDRELLFAILEQDLKKELSELEFKQLHKQNIGFFRGDKFYITLDRGHYFAHGIFYQPIQSVKELSSQEITKFIQKYGVKNPYENNYASVRTKSEISDEEKEYLRAKDSIIKTTIEQIVGKPITDQELPRIAVCFSGGGFRAMLGSIGFLSGLEEHNILQLVSYVSALSGSAWAVVPWVMSNSSLSDMKLYLRKATQGRIFTFAKDSYRDIQLALLFKWLNKQPMTFVDLWGAMIGHAVFQSPSIQYPQIIGFSQAQKHLARGALPLPIVTMISNNLQEQSNEYMWFEVTPYDAGCAEIPFFVPTWAFGRKFNHGATIDQAPELSAAFIMGISGSAFASATSDIINRLPDPLDKLGLLIAPLIHQFEKQIELVRSKRIIPGGYVRNPLYGIGHGKKGEKENIELIDPGYAINLSMIPLLRQSRAIDIIIVFDLSAEIKNVSALRGTSSYAKKHKFRFPEIDYKQAGEKTFSVFGNPHNKDELVIIYMPHIANPQLSDKLGQFNPEKAAATFGFAGTFSLIYNEENAALLQDYAQGAVGFHKQEIMEVIKARVKAKGNKHGL